MRVRTLPATYTRLLPALRNTLSLASLVILPVVWWTMVTAATSTPGINAGGDAYGYWLAWRGGLYDIAWHGPHAFVYTPPVGLALWPFSLLPWPVFYGLLAGVGMAAVVWMVGLPWAGLTLILFYPATHDLAIGNVHILIAFAIAAGHTNPAWWSVALLTKVTPGISLAYYVAAREWRHALYAAGIASLFGLSLLVIGPWGIGLWSDWAALARDGLGGSAHPWALLDWPLTVRLPIALGLALLGGGRRWPWLLPVSVMFALPVLWVSAPALLLAIPRLAANATARPSSAFTPPRTE